MMIQAGGITVSAKEKTNYKVIKMSEIDKQFGMLGDAQVKLDNAQWFYVIGALVESGEDDLAFEIYDSVVSQNLSSDGLGSEIDVDDHRVRDPEQRSLWESQRDGDTEAYYLTDTKFDYTSGKIVVAESREDAVEKANGKGNEEYVVEATVDELLAEAGREGEVVVR